MEYPFAPETYGNTFSPHDPILAVEAPAASPQLDWDEAVALPQEGPMNPALISKIEEEIRILLNIGKKRVVGDATLASFMEPLNLPDNSQEFGSKLLSRIETLQKECSNNGAFRPFRIGIDNKRLLWGTKDEIQSIPPFKWFSLLLVPVPNSSPGSSQCLALSILRGCNINKFAHDKVPVIVICLPEPRSLSVETSTNNRRFLMVFPLLTAALFTPPDIWCQIVARFLIYFIIELAIFVASIVQKTLYLQAPCIGWASLEAPTPNKKKVGIVELSLEKPVRGLPAIGNGITGRRVGRQGYALGSAAHLFRVQRRRGVLTRPHPTQQVRGVPAIGSNPATFLVDHPVVTG
ncbi:hypothetical protein ACFE04_019649 [Oxalis oulophora]